MTASTRYKARLPFVTEGLFENVSIEPKLKDIWRLDLEAVLGMPTERQRFLTDVVAQRDALHAVSCAMLDEQAYHTIIAIDKGEIGHFKANAATFCPVWAALFQGRKSTAHSLLQFRHFIGDFDEFIDWALPRRNRTNRAINQIWVDRFVGMTPKQARLARQIAAQADRGRTKGPIGGDPSRKPRKDIS